MANQSILRNQVLVLSLLTPAANLHAQSPNQVALNGFQGHGDQTIDAFLQHLRPVPLTAEERSKVLASLPRDGEVRPSPKQRAKIAAAECVLDYSARGGAIAVKVIDLDFAFAGLYYRSVVLISARALDLLDTDEFAAIMAHEVGHDYDWNDYRMAIQRDDVDRMRQLELKADGIAVLTLQRVGIDTERLVSAVQKWTRYNQLLDADQRPAASASALAADARYVPLKERVTFIRAVARLHWAGGSRRAMPPWSHKCRQRTLATPMERIEHLTSCGQGFCH